VTAINAIGESQPATLDLLAASVPQKLSAPTLVSSTANSIEMKTAYPQFDGGSAETLYAFRSDNGPLTVY
jgi:hypothetical protein